MKKQMTAKLKGLFFVLVHLLIGNLSAQTYATYTSADIYQQMKKLNVLGSVLYIAAHPVSYTHLTLPTIYSV